MSRLGRFAPNQTTIIRAPAPDPGIPPAKPIVIADQGGLYLWTRTVDPFTLVGPPITEGTVAVVSGTATASATVTGSATTPNGPTIRPIVVNDAGASFLARQFADPTTILAPPLVDAAPGVGSVAGSATASATITGSATTPGGRPVPLVVQGDQAGALRARTIVDPFTLLAPPAQEANTGDVAGTANASATVTGSASGPASTTVRGPLVYTDSGAGYRARSSQYDPTIMVWGQVAPGQATGTLTGTVTAGATVTGSAIAPAFGDVSGPVTAAATVVGQTGLTTAVLGQATASGTVTGHAASSVGILGTVQAGATITGAQSGGNFHPVASLTTFGRRLVRILTYSRRDRHG